MPVVINEFETMSDQPAQQTAPAPDARPVAPPPDVERLLRERRVRAERVRAY